MNTHGGLVGYISFLTFLVGGYPVESYASHMCIDPRCLILGVVTEPEASLL